MQRQLEDAVHDLAVAIAKRYAPGTPDAEVLPLAWSLAPLLWELIDAVLDEETIVALLEIAQRHAWRPLSVDDLVEVADNANQRLFPQGKDKAGDRP